MNIQYNELQINIIAVDVLYVDNYKLDVLNITIVKNGDSINLGHFYTDVNIKDNIENFINNIDDIIFLKNRYIGENSKVENYLIEHDNSNINIRDIYLEYVNLDKSSNEYKKYSRFLEMYFCNHEITDDIKEIFLQKENKSILDYENIDDNIKNEFCGSIGGIREEKDYEMDLVELKKIEKKSNILYDEIVLIKEIIDTIKQVLDDLDKKIIMIDNLKKLNNEVNQMRFFNKQKRIKRNEIYDLKLQLEDKNIGYYKALIKSKINEYIIKYEDSYGLNLLTDQLSFSDLLTIIEGLYNNKKVYYDKLKEEQTKINNNLSNYQNYCVDISDLYERLESNKVKEQV